jgi:putative ABC transport system permease protein
MREQLQETTMQTVNIPTLHLLAMYSLLLIPLGLFFKLKIKLSRDLIIGAVRMTAQLLLVGLYLKYIFELNAPWLSALWIAVMLLTANTATLRKTNLKLKPFFWTTLGGMTFSTLFVSFIFIAVIHPHPFYDARYLVPITGMVLGNCLRGNVISLERFFSSVRENENEYMTYLMLGATRSEAVLPYLRNGVLAAIGPSLATMSTIGLVSLPGMMTGQILGGSFPLVAIKYQIGIMLCIFTATSLTAYLNIRLSLSIAFDDYHNLRPSIFRK